MAEYIVIANKLNFREGPQLTAAVITVLPRGQIVDGGPAASAGWLEVTTIVPSLPGETRGFVSAEFAVETAAAAPPPAPSASRFDVTFDHLRKLAPHAKKAFADPLAGDCLAVRQRHGLSIAPLQICHFMAQLAHEAAGFITMREFWGPTPAQRRYEGRADLGNTRPGDGKRFMGRGYIQVTGRANYARYGSRLNQPLTASPALAEQPLIALDIACLYWLDRKIDEPAGRDDVAEVTRRINGGRNGLAERAALLRKAKQIWM